jgi:hypothetical protein
LALYSGQRDTRSAPKSESRQARANGAVTWRSATIYGTRQPEPGLRPQHHLSITHDRYGSSSHPLHNGRLIHPQDIDAPLHIAAQRKINSCRQQYANMSFLPAILSTSTRMHGELLRLFFLQAQSVSLRQMKRSRQRAGGLLAKAAGAHRLMHVLSQSAATRSPTSAQFETCARLSRRAKWSR